MANGKVTRRGVLTVDLDCPICRGDGVYYKNVSVGYGPSAARFGVQTPCECLEAVELPDGALKEG